MPQAELTVVQDVFADALRHHQAGRLADAERLYRQILEVDCRHADALHLLGVIAHQVGRNDVAVELIGQAIGINGSAAAYHSNLGNVLRNLGRLDDAVASCGAALRIKPDYAEAHSNLGNALKDLGRLDDAVASYGAALRIKPDYAEVHFNLGNVLKDLGRRDDAVASYGAALRIKPDYAAAHSNLGTVLEDLGRLDDAVASYGAALRIKPDYAEAHFNLGNVLKDLGRLDDAVASYGAALRIKPDYAEAHSNLGNALLDLGRLDDAVASYGAALRTKPDLTGAHSNLLMCLHYRPEADGATILEAARHFARRFEGRPAPTFQCRADPDRRLRIGYVSGDFGRHPVGYFLNRVLAGHDRTKMEIFCYNSFLRADDMTNQLRRRADHWRSLVGLSDQAGADLITADGIDILVDLSGHTEHNRLTLFTRKPAPVQATWLGFWGTTGLSTIDYILSDAATIPPGEERFYSEQVLRLPNGRFCYDPPDYAPPPASPPALRGRAITFGSFNNLTKIGPEVVRLWAEILRAVPGSRLLLKWKTLADAGVRRRLTEAFAADGIGPERLELRGASPHAAMLAEYGEIDVALDPFPFSGALTSCEALWMGVPVVTLPGAAAASRQTQGILQVLGLTEWIAASPADNVRIAATLASDLPRLAELRPALRKRIASSPLCDGPAFTAGLERAYRQMWRQWCAGKSAASFDLP